jgi:hypothetical protein
MKESNFAKEKKWELEEVNEEQISVEDALSKYSEKNHTR